MKKAAVKEKPLAQKKKQRTKKPNVSVKISMCPAAIVSVWQDDISQLSLPWAYQLLQALENVEQVPTTTTLTKCQSIKSPCPKRPAHIWPELWEPKASLHAQAPKLRREKSLSEKLEHQTGSKLLKYQPSLPPIDLQNSKQAASARSCKWLPGLRSATKEVQQRLVKVSDLPKIDAFPIEISVIPGFRRLPIIYHDWYNLRFTRKMRGHHDLVMLPDKPACIYSLLEREFALSKAHRCRFVEWRAVDIFTIYDMSDYIPDPVRKCDILNIARIMKIRFYETIPNWDIFDNVVLHPLRIQMTGSVVACKLAIDGGWAVNLGGGFGYNTPRISKGLAVYDDIPVCLAIMSKLPIVRHILVINCDLYQSPRYKYVKGISCPVTIVDFYHQPINEPAVREPIFPFGCTTDNKVVYYGYKLDDMDSRQYMMQLTKTLITILAGFSMAGTAKPSLCIYIAGTNVLGSTGLTKEDIIERDRVVFQMVQDDNDIPMAVLLGGGHEIDDAETAAASIFQLCNIGLLNLKWHHRLVVSLKHRDVTTSNS